MRKTLDDYYKDAVSDHSMAGHYGEKYFYEDVKDVNGVKKGTKDQMYTKTGDVLNDNTGVKNSSRK